MLNIGFFGDGPWADKTLKKISKDNKFSLEDSLSTKNQLSLQSLNLGDLLK